MRPAGATASALVPVWCGWLALVLSACIQISPTSEAPSPAMTIAPPRLQVLTETPVPTQIAATENRSEPTPLPESLVELARAVHGARLIEWLTIPRIDVYAPVAPVGWQIMSDGQYGSELAWDSPDAGVGWAVSSALPGDPANIILYGHNNLNASVFLRLGEMQPGDEIKLTTGEHEWEYRVETVMILAADDNGIETAYQASSAPGSSPRLTIWSCWPPAGNSHRVIVVACPDGRCGE